MRGNLILVGGAGHCKSVIDVAESAGYTILGILDRQEEVGKKVLGYEVIGTDDDMAKYAGQAEFIVTVGQIKSPDVRIRLHRMLSEAGCRLATIIASTAHVSKHATIGEGTVVMHQAVVNADARIGKGCIINTFANVEHDAVIGDYCHISTGTMVNGECKVGNHCFIGCNTNLISPVTLGDYAYTAAGSTITSDVPENALGIGRAKQVNKEDWVMIRKPYKKNPGDEQ